MYKPTREQPPGVFLQPADGSLKVWRYLSLPKLLYGLDRRALILPRLDLLKDSHEGAWARSDQRHFRDALEGLGLPSEALTSVMRMRREARQRFRKSFFVSSWHLNNSESEAMWQLYCGKDQGVALQTTYAQLDASLLADESSHTDWFAIWTTSWTFRVSVM